MKLKNVLKSVVVAGTVSSALMFLQGCCHDREVYDYTAPAPTGSCDRCGTKCNTCHHEVEYKACDTGCAPKRTCGSACNDNSQGWYGN